MQERIQSILKSVFTSHEGDFDDSLGPDDVSDWDSLNHLNLVMAINNEFGVNLEFEEILEIKTVGDIKNILKKHGIS
jgi:acyl carrier protein